MVNQLRHRMDLIFDSSATKKGYFAFLIMYAVAYWGEPIYFTYLPIYFRQIGFNNATIGILYSLGPAIALLAQPMWGRWGDRSPVKNHVLYYILAGSGISMLLMGFSQSLPYIFTFFIIHVFFRTSQHPVEDSLSLDFLSQHQLRFGPIRGIGTLGYMFVAAFIGMAMKVDARTLFPLYLLFSLISIWAIRRTPPIMGQMKLKQKIDFKQIRHGKLLLGYVAFSFLISIPYGFYSTFFAIYLTTDLGGTMNLLGILMITSASAEVFFLFYGEKLLARFGMNNLLLVAALISLLRWVLTYLVTDPVTQVFVQMLHGFSFIVVHFCLVNYIHQCVPPAVRTSGQTMYSLVTNGLGRIIPSLAGGYISALYGIRILFLISSVMLLVALALLIWLIIRSRGSKDALHSF